MRFSVIKRFRNSPTLLLLAIGVFLLAFLAYKLAIARTIDAIKNVHELSEKAANLEKFPQQLEELTMKLVGLDQIIGGADSSSSGVRQEILNRLTVLGGEHPCSIIDIPEEYSYRKQDYTLLINTFVLEGTFPDLLHILYDLETSMGSGQVISAQFYIRKDHITRKSRLELAIYLQHIKKRRNEI